MNLYQLGREEMRLCELLEIEDMTPEQDAELCDLFAAHADRESRKVDGYIKVLRSYELQAAAIAMEVGRLNARARKAVEAQERLKARLQWYMETTQKNSIDGALGGFELRKKPDHVEIDDIDLLPPQMLRVIPEKCEADKVAIKAALKSGVTIPGARMEPGGYGVRLKMGCGVTDDGE